MDTFRDVVEVRAAVADSVACRYIIGGVHGLIAGIYEREAHALGRLDRYRGRARIGQGT
jgi:hypothetical protein